MRVLHVYSHYHPDTFGGGEFLINQVARSTAAHGVRSTVLTLSPHPQPPVVTVDGHPVHRVGIDFSLASARFSLALLGRLRALAREADLLHFYYPWPWGDLAWLLAGSGKPYVVSQLSDIVKQRLLRRVYAPLERVFLGGAAALVATSPNYAQTSPVVQRWQAKSTVIPIGLDAAQFPAPGAEQLAHWRQRAGGRFLLFLGVLRYYKGLNYLLDAVAGTDMRVVVAGDGPEAAALQAQAAALGLGEQVVFAGRVSEADKHALLTLCEGFVFPSHLRAESFGVSLLEAAAHGKPMVSCEIGSGTSYINRDGETGFVVAPGDAGALRGAMERLWADAELAARLGQAARARAQTVFSAGVMGEAYARLYGRVLGGAPAITH
jgi:rhamnosyl/mannosyltransferase